MMARPATKAELLAAAEQQFEKMWAVMEGMTPEQRYGTFQFEDRDRNIRDILVHLYEWHQLLLRWVKANRAGQEQSFLPAPYNWRTYPQMNVGFWEKHQETADEDAVKMLLQSHRDVMACMEAFSDQELFTKKHFPWTGNTSLGSYCVSATSSHYDWAIKKMKKHLKGS